MDARPLDYETLSLPLHQLSDAILLARLSPSSSDEPFNPSQYLVASAPIFAALHSQNRLSHVSTKRAKQRTGDARGEVETKALRLQNLKFEQAHLEKEIKSCLEFKSEIPQLPIPDDSSLPSDLTLPSDAHEKTLALLNWELEERKRLDLARQALGKEKLALVRENEIEKSRLDELEREVEEFVANARKIQARMHQVASASKPTPTSVTASNTEDAVMSEVPANDARP